MYPIELAVICETREIRDELMSLTGTYALQLHMEGVLRDYTVASDPKQHMIRLGYSDFRIKFGTEYEIFKVERSYEYRVMSKLLDQEYRETYQKLFQQVIDKDLSLLGIHPDDPKVSMEIAFYSENGGLTELSNFLKELETDLGPGSIRSDGGRWFINYKIRVTMIRLKDLENLDSSPFCGIIITPKTIQEHKDEITKLIHYYTT